MRKSTLHLVVSLKDRLSEFPGLVDSLEKKDLSFLNRLMTWIRRSEEIFATYNISEVSELAGIRSRIIAPGYSGENGNARKKLQLKLAADSLYDIQHIVLQSVTRFEQKVAECRELVRQLLLIIGQARLIRYNRDLPFENLVTDIWNCILSSDQLKAGAVKLRTTLSLTDIRLLIAEEITLEDF